LSRQGQSDFFHVVVDGILKEKAISGR